MTYKEFISLYDQDISEIFTQQVYELSQQEFLKMDFDEDWKVTLQELQFGMKETLSEDEQKQFSIEQNRQEFKEMDKNQDAYIDYKEYVDSFIRITKENIGQIPGVQDLQQPGSNPNEGEFQDMGEQKALSYQDYKKQMIEMREDENLKEQDILKSFELIDKNNDMIISHREISQFMTSYKDKSKIIEEALQNDGFYDKAAVNDDKLKQDQQNGDVDGQEQEQPGDDDQQDQTHDGDNSQSQQQEVAYSLGGDAEVVINQDYQDEENNENQTESDL